MWTWIAIVCFIAGFGFMLLEFFRPTTVRAAAEPALNWEKMTEADLDSLVDEFSRENGGNKS